MYRESLSAGVPISWNITGRHFRLVETVGPVTITFYRRGAEISEAIDVEAGYSEWWPETAEGFDKVELSSATAQTVKFAIRTESRVEYDRAVGNVAVTNNNGSFFQAAYAISTSSSNLRVQKLDRRYLSFQNRSASANVFVRVDGNGATLASGIKIPPGGFLEFFAFVPTGAVNAVADIAVPLGDFLVIEG